MKIKEAFNKDNIFFTSDTHFGHKNIIEYCSRPFDDVYKMNEAIVDNWNKVIPKDGIVFHLGDFALASDKTINHCFYALNGQIHFLWGNHDRSKGLSKLPFLSISDLLEITVEDEEIDDKYQKLVLCHYPIASFHGAHKGYWHLFGHCHGTFNHPHPAAFDCGVDSWNFNPISYHEVKAFLTKRAMEKKFTPIDHHK